MVDTRCVQTGELARLVDEHKSAHGVPDSELARRIGMSRQGLHLWRTVGRKGLPDPDNLRSFAAIAGVSYRQVLDAALADTGYLEADERSRDVLTPADIVDVVGIVTGTLRRPLTDEESSRLRMACGDGHDALSLSGIANTLALPDG